MSKYNIINVITLINSNKDRTLTLNQKDFNITLTSYIY